MAEVNYLRKIGLIYYKDLNDEFRTFDNLLSMVVFGIMLVFIFSFAFQLTNLEVDQAFPAVMWVSIFFSAILGIQRSFAKEKDSDVMDALLLATGDRGSIFLAKFLCNLTVLLLFELIVVPLFWLFTGISSVKGMNYGLLLAALFWGSWGLAAIGTMLNGITIQLPSARLLFPILLFPLLVPLLIGVIQCSNAAITTQSTSVSGWLYLMICFDLVFTVLPFVLFDFILEG